MPDGRSLRALIFDVDGTLAETEEAHRRAFNLAFEHWGLGWHWDRRTYAGLLRVTGGKERIAAWIAEDDSRAQELTETDIAGLHARKNGYYSELIGRGINLRPGIDALIRQARAEGVAVGIATTTSIANVERLVQSAWGCDACEVFDAIAAGDEVASKKPAPDVYFLALQRLNVGPDHALAFEDSANGPKAAKCAGLYVVASPSIYTVDDDFGAADLLVPEFDDNRVKAMFTTLQEHQH